MAPIKPSRPRPFFYVAYTDFTTDKGEDMESLKKASGGYIILQFKMRYILVIVLRV